MNIIQKKLNEKLGEELREARKKKGLTQDQLCTKIIEYYFDSIEKELKKIDLNQKEIEMLFDTDFNELDKSLQKKLITHGIKKSYKPTAISTISKYENGTWEILSWYYDLIMNLLTHGGLRGHRREGRVPGEGLLDLEKRQDAFSREHI